MAWSIQIPEGEDERLLFLLRLSDLDFEHIVESVRTVQPTSQVGVFARRVLQKSGVRDNEVIQLLLSLNAIFTAASSTGEEMVEVAADLAGQLVSSHDLPASDGQKLASRLADLLSIPNVSFVAQAFSASVRGNKVFQRVRFSTDLNPLYMYRNGTGEVAAASILHELHLTFYSDDRETVFTCQLDHDDLLELRSELERALAQRKLLEDFMQRTELQLVRDDGTITE